MGDKSTIVTPSTLDAVERRIGHPIPTAYRFDYKCSDGYTVVHESIARWLETNIALLERGVFFRAATPAEIQARVRIGNKINGKYTKCFENPLPLE